MGAKEMSQEQADRHNGGKIQLSYVLKAVLAGVARVYMFGAEKYSPHNWMKGMQYSTALDSMGRHLAAWQIGEEVDQESGQHHLDHALWNLMALRYNTVAYPENDDRPRLQQVQMDRLLEFLKAPYLEPHRGTDLPGDPV